MINFIGNRFASFYNKPLINNDSKMSFGSRKASDKLSLVYVLKKVPEDKFPPRVLARVKELVQSLPKQLLPSLYDLHKQIYAPLLNCKTLEEAKALFPEFANVKSAGEIKSNRKSAINKANNGKLLTPGSEDLALFLLKGCYAQAKSVAKIVEAIHPSVSASVLARAKAPLNIPRISNLYSKLLLNSNQEYYEKNAQQIRDLLWRDPECRKQTIKKTELGLRMRRRRIRLAKEQSQNNPELTVKKPLK